MTLAASTSTNKSLKDFDELMNTPIDFSGYILNGLKMENLTQEVLLRPAFRLLKSTRSSYAKLEYDFEECYKDLLEKLDCENLEGGDYPFDLSKPLPLIQSRKRQRVPFEFFIDNDLKYQIHIQTELEWITQGYPLDSGRRPKFDESDTYVLERFDTSAGNPVKKILHKLNLSDHRLILTDSKEYLKMVMELINDMNIYKMKMEQFQVNTKFLNSLPPEWSKFVTDVKLVKDLHTSNFDQLHAYLEQHELHANEVRIMRERNQDPLAFVANQQMTPPHFNTYQSPYNNPQLQQQFSPSQHASIQPNQHYSSHYPSQTQFNHSSIPPSHTFQSQMNHQTLTVPQVIPQVAYQSSQTPIQLMTESSFGDSGFAVLVFSLGDDPIACLNKAMAFLTAVAFSRFPTTNNQLKTSSNPRNQATIQDGRVTVQQVQGRQGQNYSGTTYKGNATSSRGNITSGQARVIKSYNCQGDGHMARQCTQPKRPRNASWYKEKVMLAEAQESRQILDEEQLAFLADAGIPADQLDNHPLTMSAFPRIGSQ
ncbi:integrase, catalytic region, zinc finger, CCHC-type containing protein [Tanacetum coccineum]